MSCIKCNGPSCVIINAQSYCLGHMNEHFAEVRKAEQGTLYDPTTYQPKRRFAIRPPSEDTLTKRGIIPATTKEQRDGQRRRNSRRSNRKK